MDASGWRSTIERLGSTAVTSAPTSRCPSLRARRPPVLTSQSSVLIPADASRSASEAATVLFPTPPFPVTSRRRLSSRPDMRGKERRTVRIASAGCQRARRACLTRPPRAAKSPAGQGRHAEEQCDGQEDGRDGRVAVREARPGSPLQRAVRGRDPDPDPADALRQGRPGQEPPLGARGDEPAFDRGRRVAAAEDRGPRHHAEPHRGQAGEGSGAAPLSPGAPPVRRIAFVNEKGGTGKTTLAVHVAAWLARARNLRVLLLDLDTQGHAG